MQTEEEIKEPENLMQGLIREMNRVREIIPSYEEFPGGKLAALLMKHDIKQAERAIGEGDVIKMLTAYNALKQCQL